MSSRYKQTVQRQLSAELIERRLIRAAIREHTQTSRLDFLERQATSSTHCRWI